MTSFRKSAAVPAFVAAISLAGTPAAAADMPAPVSASPIQAAPGWAPGDDTSDYHRRYRYRRHRGVSAGDVLAGVLIIGGIAAIANAAKNSDDRRYRDRDYRYPDQRRDDYRQDYDARGVDRAVEMCADEVERNARIGSIDTVNRTASGWQVTGSLYNGDGFTCSIGQDGRIDAIEYGRGGSGYQGAMGEYDDAQNYDGGQDYADADRQEDRQYDSDYYSAARSRMDANPLPTQTDAQPAYPGGPLPGEAQDEPDIEYGNGYKGVGAGS
ncbi:hypothetical protein P8R33_07245 [Qipengyuania sp. XHP0211]|uniref:hypothetical protein n=1 Tax=Qipengyuania sp. XHP0211 TaxID=3038079 RepID=UPI00241C529E|nr:hypothetical protein [Qipengyuania sp. XHP0211]MDG5750894.1 hypothetical protein [Qipengyuania sp. XHP0211]